jgi:hypothetical protein
LLASSFLHLANCALTQVAYYTQGYTGHLLGAVTSGLFWAVSIFLILLGPGTAGSGKTHTSHWLLGERKKKRRLADNSEQERKKI